MSTTTQDTQLTHEQGRDYAIYQIISFDEPHNGLTVGTRRYMGQALADIRVRDSVVWHVLNGTDDTRRTVLNNATLAYAHHPEGSRARGESLAVAAIAVAALCDVDKAIEYSRMAMDTSSLGWLVYQTAMIGGLTSALDDLANLPYRDCRHGTQA